MGCRRRHPAGSSPDIARFRSPVRSCRNWSHTQDPRRVPDSGTTPQLTRHRPASVTAVQSQDPQRTCSWEPFHILRKNKRPTPGRPPILSELDDKINLHVCANRHRTLAIANAPSQAAIGSSHKCMGVHTDIGLHILRGERHDPIRSAARGNRALRPPRKGWHCSDLHVADCTACRILSRPDYHSNLGIQVERIWLYLHDQLRHRTGFQPSWLSQNACACAGTLNVCDAHGVPRIAISQGN